jgi:hypothetical protein
MELLTPFDKKIIRIQCTDETLYRNADLHRSVENLLSLSDVQNRPRNEPNDSHVGSGVTSVGQTYLKLVNLPGAQGLTEWVSQQLLMAKSILGIQKKGNKIEYKRSWVNRLYRGAQGKCHQHVKLDDYMRERTDYSEVNFRSDVVAIFYVDIPPNSSDLVVINNGRPATFVEEYEDKDKFVISPSAGHLVIHTPDVWHAVSVHNSDLHRTCFVFDADYT